MSLQDQQRCLRALRDLTEHDREAGATLAELDDHLGCEAGDTTTGRGLETLRAHGLVELSESTPRRARITGAGLSLFDA